MFLKTKKRLNSRHRRKNDARTERMTLAVPDKKVPIVVQGFRSKERNGTDIANKKAIFFLQVEHDKITALSQAIFEDGGMTMSEAREYYLLQQQLSECLERVGERLAYQSKPQQIGFRPNFFNLPI